MTINCAWCDEPAIKEIEVQEPQYRTVTKQNERGEKITHKQLAKRAIMAPVCEAHAGITKRQPEKVGRGKRKPGPDQVTVFDFPEAFKDVA